MKLTAILIMVSTFGLLASETYAQSKRLTLKMENAKVEEVLANIQKQSEFYFFVYSEKVIDADRRVTVNLEEQNIETVLKTVFAGTDVAYIINDRLIVLSTPEVLGKVSPAVAQQQRAVSGKVTDESGQPLPGVTIVIKGTTQGTVTNADGEYSISSLPEGATLRFSFVGMRTQEVVVGSQTTINVEMVVDAIGLEEVVAIGYGVQKKVSVTSSVGTVSGETLVEQNATDVRQLLQGRLAGLNVTDIGGAPGGANMTLRVRGLTSLGNNDPLILVDGIESPDFNWINPNDIENISILKDAASTSIYGSRAANGVILITTKRAKIGKMNVTYNGYYGLQESVQKLTHMPIEDYMRMQNTAYDNSFGAPIYSEEEINTWVNATDRLKYPLPNTWYDAMYRLAPQTDHNVSVSGGNEKVKSYVSLRYNKQDGVVPNFSQEMYNFRTNTDFDITDKIKFSVDIDYRRNKLLSPRDPYSVFTRMHQTSQWTVPKYPDGTYGISSDGHNPLLYAEIDGLNTQKPQTLSGNLNFEWKFLDGFSFKPHFGARIWNQKEKQYANKYKVNDYYNPDQILKQRTMSTMNESRRYNEQFTLDLLLNYVKTFKENHNLSVLLGYSEIYNASDYITAYRQDFYNNDIQSINAGANDGSKNNSGAESSWGLRSYFGRLNYDFQGKYLFEANARYDGSSRFTGNNKYSFFPSFSAGWRISQENFWEGYSDVMNEFKLRSSWGQTGNQAVGLYSYIETLSARTYPFGTDIQQGYLITDLSDPNISWETTDQFDIGLDLGFLNNKITVTFDYYKKSTKEILLDVPIPKTIGLNPSVQNAGVMDNEGFEFELGLKHKFASDFGIFFSQIVTYNKNTVKDLAGTGPYIWGDSEIRNIVAEGHPYREFWGYLTDGLFQTQEEVDSYPTWTTGTAPGDVKYIDLNKDGAITPEDMTYLGGSYFPDWNLTSSFVFTYKNFTLDMLWQGVAGAKRYIGGAIMQMGIWGGFTSDIFTDNYWTPENPDAEFPRPTKFEVRNTQLSDRSIQNGAYMRLKNLKLKYDLPKSWMKTIGIQGMSVYASGTNLLTFSELNRWEVNPESDNRDGDSVYPQTSLYSIGLNVNF